MTDKTASGHLSPDKLEAIVRDADLGGRDAKGMGGRIIAATCVAWSLFQLWYASPLPFMTGFLILNDTEAVSYTHLTLPTKA
jgi:TRAP-type uncharacterized transport system fused permease subunit